MKKIAFWRHDVYPFVLHGEVSKELPDGNVVVTNYGNAVFKPLVILPFDEGDAIAKNLISLTREYDFKKRALSKEFIAKAESVASFISRNSLEYGVKCPKDNIYTCLNGYVFFAGDVYALKEKYVHLLLISELQKEKIQLSSYSQVVIKSWTLALTSFDDKTLEFKQACEGFEDYKVSKEVINQLHSAISAMGFLSPTTLLNGKPLYTALNELKEYGKILDLEPTLLIDPTEEDDYGKF